MLLGAPYRQTISCPLSCDELTLDYTSLWKRWFPLIRGATLARFGARSIKADPDVCQSFPMWRSSFACQ